MKSVGSLAGQKRFPSRMRKLLDISTEELTAMRSNGEGYKIIPTLREIKKKLRDKGQWMEEQFEAPAVSEYPC